MSEMVERVAAATANNHIPGSWDGMNETGKNIYLSNARAAIEAMRDPTAAMIIAGDKAYRDCGGGPHYSGCDGSTCCHRAMIDEALK